MQICSTWAFYPKPFDLINIAKELNYDLADSERNYIFLKEAERLKGQPFTRIRDQKTEQLQYYYQSHQEKMTYMLITLLSQDLKRLDQGHF